jgi:hypothetical protein
MRVSGQSPTGEISGLVKEPSDARISNASVRLRNVSTGIERTTTSSGEGEYSFLALMSGEYEISAEAAGFRKTIRLAVVEAGGTTEANLTLSFGVVTESITVEGASPQMHYDSYSIGGTVTRDQIENLPLNGRGFLELGKLEPGVQPSSRASNNRTFVPVLGTPTGNNGRGTRVTIDGGSIMAVGNGASAMGFSQEVVQEFQISTVNFDLSTGLTFGGAANVVTRSGGNELHGSALYFFRDHTLSAYPALTRDPASPDPFFQRRQFGFSAGGAVRPNRFFFFGNWERNEQRGVVGTTVSGADFAHFSRIVPTPFFGNQLSLRLDGRISDRHTVFIRYSHDGNHAFGPSSLTAPLGTNLYPSDWTRQLAWADQSMLGVTSVLRPTVVHDLRFSYFFISSSETPPLARDCPGCLGLGAPIISVAQTNLYIGESANSFNLGRRYHLNDSLAWQKGFHRARFGVDGEHNRGGPVLLLNEPVTMTLFSPDQARQARIPVPASFQTLDEILQLPLQSVTVGIGDPRVPQENGGNVRHWNTLRLYFTDVWRVHPRLTVNYGLAWSIDRNLNYDLPKPALLAPILGDVGPTRKQWSNFSPALGFAWAPAADDKTVIRAGAGIYYDFLFPGGSDLERAALGPPGLGRTNYSGTGIPVLCPGTPKIDFTGNPSSFTGANLMALLPSIRNCLSHQLVKDDPGVQSIQLTKQFPAALGSLIPADYPSASSQHVNAGIQREVARDFVVSADFVYRHFVHISGGAGDLNHINSTLGPPVIPKCVGAQASDPQAICANGPIIIAQNAGRATYKGLLLRATKRLSHRFQAIGSYAYSNETGTNAGSGFNLYDRLANVGPLERDYRQIANLAAVAQLPRGFDLALNFSYSSASPFTASIGADLNGDGTTNDLLPGTTVNAFNRGMGRSDLERLVAQFNQTYAGKNDAQGKLIRAITLPASYSFGDNLHSLDLRLTRTFLLRGRSRLALMGEVFNLYNKANLSGYSGDLTSAAFGQPTSRATQVFGSGGPRAFQVAARIGF